MRIKISRKEAKESRYWLRLLDTGEAGSLDTICFEFRISDFEF